MGSVMGSSSGDVYNFIVRYYFSDDVVICLHVPGVSTLQEEDTTCDADGKQSPESHSDNWLTNEFSLLVVNISVSAPYRRKKEQKYEERKISGIK